jgi:hypothetical protein
MQMLRARAQQKQQLAQHLAQQEEQNSGQQEQERQELEEEGRLLQAEAQVGVLGNIYAWLLLANHHSVNRACVNGCKWCWSVHQHTASVKPVDDNVHFNLVQTPVRRLSKPLQLSWQHSSRQMPTPRVKWCWSSRVQQQGSHISHCRTRLSPAVKHSSPRGSRSTSSWRRLKSRLSVRHRCMCTANCQT